MAIFKAVKQPPVIKCVLVPSYLQNTQEFLKEASHVFGVMEYDQVIGRGGSLISVVLRPTAIADKPNLLEYTGQYVGMETDPGSFYGKLVVINLNDRDYAVEEIEGT
jgi:hypothetical protein